MEISELKKILKIIFEFILDHTIIFYLIVFALLAITKILSIEDAALLFFVATITSIQGWRRGVFLSIFLFGILTLNFPRQYVLPFAAIVLIILYFKYHRYSDDQYSDDDDYERTQDYRNYLHSNHWKAVRSQKLKEVNHTCEGCGVNYAQLEVHHTHYNSLGNESMRDLQALCRDCHQKVHDE